MQKTIEDRSRIGVFSYQWHVEKQYESIWSVLANRMQKPVEGIVSLNVALFK